MTDTPTTATTTTPEPKPWYRSKTKWGALVAGISLACKAVPVLLPAVPFLEALAAILCGFGVRDAIRDGNPTK